jgi:hypothetical protein
VSAGNSARSTLAAVGGDGVRALQHVLYRAAKASPGRRFHALRDKIYREDVLWRAWIAVRRNNGAPGIDKITLADVEEYGVTRLLGELAAELRAGTWRPMPARQVLIPKPGSTERRPLAIATVTSYCLSCSHVSECSGLVLVKWCWRICWHEHGRWCRHFRAGSAAAGRGAPGCGVEVPGCGDAVAAGGLEVVVPGDA